jgi:excinuclease UvrABC nuclease subunit
MTSVKSATVEELEKVAGINKETAINIYNYFLGNKK